MNPSIKNKFIVSLILILLVLHLNQVIVTAEDVTKIHTPDFPELLNEVLNKTTNSINYSEYFQLIKEFFDLANNNASFEELLKSAATSENLDKLIDLMNESGDFENAHKLEVLKNYDSLSPEELLQSISSDELRNLLQEALKSGFLNKEILEEINNMYVSGSIGFNDYVKALYFLKKVGRDSDLVMNVDSLLTKVLLDSLTDSSLKILSKSNTDLQILNDEAVSEALKSMMTFFSKEPQTNNGLVETLENLLSNTNTLPLSKPEVRFPQLRISLPTLITPFNVESLVMPLSLAMVLLGVLVLTYLFIKRGKIPVVFSRTSLGKTYPMEGLNIKSETVRIYWNSVKLLEKKLLPRSLNETHREYLNKVLKTTPNIGETFKYLTEAYEKVRWGAHKEDQFIHNVKKAYEDLVRGLSMS